MTTRPSDWLNHQAKNVYSQYGEDGILEAIFSLIPHQKWCVEFGAYDGKHLSNTHNLVKHHDWSGVMIEGSPKRFKKLLATYGANSKITPVNQFIDFDGPNSLENILATTPLPRDFDLLSIDIDGNDYHIWDSLKNFSPKVVVIEFNPSIPLDVEYIQPKDMSVNHSNSLLALVNLGHSKGYELVATTHLNAFFVRKEYFPLLEISDNRPTTLYTDTSAQMKIFQLYDGTLVIKGCHKLLWHQYDFSDKQIQVLPKYLRKFPDNFNRLEFWTLSLIYKKKYKWFFKSLTRKLKTLFKK